MLLLLARGFHRDVLSSHDGHRPRRSAGHSGQLQQSSKHAAAAAEEAAAAAGHISLTLGLLLLLPRDNGAFTSRFLFIGTCMASAVAHKHSAKAKDTSWRRQRRNGKLQKYLANSNSKFLHSKVMRDRAIWAVVK